MIMILADFMTGWRSRQCTAGGRDMRVGDHHGLVVSESLAQKVDEVTEWGSLETRVCMHLVDSGKVGLKHDSCTQDCTSYHHFKASHFKATTFQGHTSRHQELTSNSVKC